MDPSSAANPSPALTIVVPVSKMSGRLEWVDRLLSGNTGPVVIVHDKKDEATGSELLKLTSRFPKSSLIQGEFGSPGKARMAGLIRVNTPYVAFMDSDDDTLEGKEVLKLASTLHQQGGDVIAGAFLVKQLGMGIDRIFLAHSEFSKNIKGHPGIWRYVFRVAFLQSEEVEFSDLKVGEDLLFLLDCYIAGARYEHSEDVVYVYHVGVVGQATSSITAKADLLRLMSELEQRYFLSPRVNRKLISFLWMKTLFSSLKHLTAAKFRRQIFLYVLRTLFKNPALALGGFTHLIPVIQSSSSLNITAGTRFV